MKKTFIQERLNKNTGLISAKELATSLHDSEKTIYKMIKNKKINCIKLETYYIKLVITKNILKKKIATKKRLN